MINQFVNHGLGLLEKLQAFDIQADIASTPHREIEKIGAMSLRYYPSLAAKKSHAATPIFVIPSLINRYYILDLLPEKSLIRYLSEQGFSVYLLDWMQPQYAEVDFDLEQVVSLYLDYCVDRILMHSHHDQVHLFGHCLGGDLGLIYSALRPEKVKSLSLITTPVDFHQSGQLGEWAQFPTFDLENFVRAYGNAPWSLLQASFIGLKPSQMYSKVVKGLTQMNDPKFMRNFLALETWSNDNVSLRGGFFINLIQEFYRNNALVNGNLEVCGQMIDLSQLTMPIMSIEAIDDHIVDAKSTLQAHHVPACSQFKKVELKGGHIGAVIGGHSQKRLWPEWVHWLNFHQDRKVQVV